MRGHVINTISRMWAIIFWLKLECVIEKIKIKVKLHKKVQKFKTLYRNCIWIKKDKGRRKLCWNDNCNVRKYLAYWAQLNFQNEDDIIKQY